MLRKTQFKQQKGSLTVEACLIVPIVIFIMFWLLNIAFILYQYAVLKSIADQTVEVAQAAWDNPSKNVPTGRLKESKQLNDEDLYWNIVDKKQDVKLKTLKTWVEKKIANDRLMDIFTGRSKEKVTIEVHLENMSYLRRSFRVEIIDNRSTIFSPIRSHFGFGEKDTVAVISQGTIKDPAEYIRNLDWGADAVGEYSDGTEKGTFDGFLEQVKTIRESCIDGLK